MKKLIAFCIVLMASMFNIANASEPTREIAKSADDVRPILNGQNIPNTTIYTPQGKALKLHDVIKEKPSVIIFYRGGWCPYCNAQLADLKNIEDKVTALGYQLIAMSPDSPKRLSAQETSQDYKAKIFSDRDFETTQAFGIGFFLDDKVADKYRNKLGVEFVDINGTSRVALPVPAVYIVDTSGKVHFQYINPNFTVRLDSELLYQAARISDLK